MARSTRPSFPPSGEPNLRRLNSTRTLVERPLRAQLVIGFMLGLVVIAVPLYLLRRPRTAPVPAELNRKSGFGGVIRPAQEEETGGGVDLGPVQRVKCSASPRKRGNEGALCDPLPLLEDALRKGIEKNAECVPQTGKEGSINYVLEVDFPKNRINVFAGRSGKWKGPGARAAAKCVLQSFPPVPWDSLSHRYRYYMIAILATYPAPDPLEVLPRFE